MTVYVDDMKRPATVRNGQGHVKGTWCHLFADTHAELLAFADQIGLKPEWIQHEGTHREHFDVTDLKRAKAVKAGAQEISYLRDVPRLMAAKKEQAEPVKPRGMLLVTGPREGVSRATVATALRPHFSPEITLVVGDASGVDTHSAELWRSWGGQVEEHKVSPGVWKLTPSAGFDRNQRMVDRLAAEGGGQVVAIDLPCIDRGCDRAGQHMTHGTAHCAAVAAEAGLDVHHFPAPIVYPARAPAVQADRVRVLGSWNNARVPDGAVYIGRAAPGLPASPYANPFTVREHGRDEAIRQYQNHLAAHRGLIEQAHRELTGKTLACWCSPGERCHGDVLREAMASPVAPARPEDEEYPEHRWEGSKTSGTCRPCGVSYVRYWMPQGGRPSVVYVKGTQGLVAAEEPGCGEALPAPSSTPAEREQMAADLDHQAGRAAQKGAFNESAQLLARAHALSPRKSATFRTHYRSLEGRKQADDRRRRVTQGNLWLGPYFGEKTVCLCGKEFVRPQGSMTIVCSPCETNSQLMQDGVKPDDEALAFMHAWNAGRQQADRLKDAQRDPAPKAVRDMARGNEKEAML